MYKQRFIKPAKGDNSVRSGRIQTQSSCCFMNVFLPHQHVAICMQLSAQAIHRSLHCWQVLLLYVRVRVCVMHISVLVCVSMWKPEQDVRYVYHSLPTALRQDLCLNMKPALWLGRLTSGSGDIHTLMLRSQACAPCLPIHVDVGDFNSIPYAYVITHRASSHPQDLQLLLGSDNILLMQLMCNSLVLEVCHKTVGFHFSGCRSSTPYLFVAEAQLFSLGS